MATGPAVILIGPPGSGKSTVGPLLAELLDVSFADTDDLVAQAAGKPVSDIFIDDGDAAFRDLERSAVAAAIADHSGVLALGGGAVHWDGLRSLLAGQRVVYLETGFPAVVRRSGLDGPRPPMPGNPRGRLLQLLEERRPLYRELAWLTVNTDDAEPREIAGQIAVLARGGAPPGGTESP
ncbi:MAG TPA: shikimate kinase [Streptosporangiaceae bacterium]|nr:shikimate kinase [Streptosporangiaceae bacterium]